MPPWKNMLLVHYILEEKSEHNAFVPFIAIVPNVSAFTTWFNLVWGQTLLSVELFMLHTFHLCSLLKMSMLIMLKTH